MANTDRPLALVPLEEMVLGGFAQRMQQVFGAPFIVTNEHEKLKALERLFSGNPVQYPYGFISVSTFDTSNTGSYNPHYFVRHGIEMMISSDVGVQAVHCMPATIEVEIEYHTNVFMNSRRVNPTETPSLSALAFARRWVMAQRAGYTKFMVNYGKLELGINVTLSPTVTLPKKDNLVENEQVYITTVTAQIHGWVSEPILKQGGLVKEIKMSVGTTDPNLNLPQNTGFSLSRSSK